MVGRAPFPRKNSCHPSFSVNTSSLTMDNDRGGYIREVKCKWQQLGGDMWVLTVIFLKHFCMFEKFYNKMLKELHKRKK